MFFDSINKKEKGMKERPFKLPKNIKAKFSGNSPPEIFIGRYNYPNVNVGILSPETFSNTEELSIPEL